MAETLTTLAFMSAVLMIVSSLTKYGKWLSAITAVFCIVASLQIPFDAVNQSGGSVLVICSVFCIVIQYNIRNGLDEKYLNIISGVVVFVLLLSMYPQEGIVDVIEKYTFKDSLIKLIQSIIIGFVMALYLASSLSKQITSLSIATIGLLGVLLFVDFSDLSNLLVVVLTLSIFGWLPFFEDIVSKRIGSGDGRTRALGISVFFGIGIIYLTTYAAISQVERIGNGPGAITVTMWLTTAVTAFGLVGMLLPLLGLDHHARPESWGWRKGILFSPLIICLNTDLAIHIMLGIYIAILISISSPLVIEKKRRKLTS